MSAEYFRIFNSVLSTRYSVLSFDQPIRPGEHLQRNCHADLLRRLQVNDELKISHLLLRQYRGLDNFKDFVSAQSPTNL